MDEDDAVAETLVPDSEGESKPKKDNGINRTAPPYVRGVQKFAAYSGQLCGAGATILFAVIAILTGLAAGLEAVAKSYGVKVIRGEPQEGA